MQSSVVALEVGQTPGQKGGLVIIRMLERDAGYKTADKNLGAAVYSKHLFKEHAFCILKTIRGYTEADSISPTL